MSRLPKTLQLDRMGIERLPVADAVKVWLRQFVDDLEDEHKLVRDFAETLNTQDHIADASGALADIVTKFNTLLSQLEDQKILKTT